MPGNGVIDNSTSAALIGADDARRLTDRIKVAVEATWELVVEAYESRAWAALGYSSWDDYCTREFGSCRLRLPREERQEAVASLRDAGLSIRAIAAATGVGRGTVERELAGVPNGTPAPAGGAVDGHLDPELVKLVRGMEEIGVGESPTPIGSVRAATPPSTTPTGTSTTTTTNVTGVDGKRYPRTAPSSATKPKRKPLPDALRATGRDLRKAAERLVRLSEDDRFGRHKDEAAEHLRGDLEYVVDLCRGVLDQFEPTPGREPAPAAQTGADVNSLARSPNPRSWSPHGNRT